MSPAPKRRRWPRRLAILAALLVVLRVGLGLAAPTLVERLASTDELQVRCDDVDLALLAGEVSIEGLEVRERTFVTAEPMVRLEKASADLRTLKLLTGALWVHRVEVDGLFVYGERRPDGTWSWERYLPRGDGSEEPEEEDEPSAEEEGPLDLRLPLRLSALRLQHVHLHLFDGTVEPAVDLRAEAHVRLSDVGMDDGPGRLEVLVSGPRLVDSFRVDGTIESHERDALVAMQLEGLGVRPAALEGWLRPLGWTAVADRLSLGARVELTAQVSGTDGRALDLTASLSDAALAADGKRAFALAEASLGVAPLSAEEARVGAVRIAGLSAELGRSAAGALEVAGLASRAPAGAPAAPPHPGAAPDDPAPAVATAATDEPLRWSVAGVELVDVRATWSDRAAGTTVALGLDATLGAFDPRRPEAASPFELRLAAPGVFESAGAEGTVRLAGDRTAVALALRAEGVAPEALRPYLADAGLESTLEAGSASGSLELDLVFTNDGLRAELAATDLRLEDGGRALVGADGLTLTGLHVASNGVARVELLELSGPRLALSRDADGALHAVGVRTSGAADPASPAAASDSTSGAPASGANAAATGAAGALPRIDLGRLAVTDARVSFDDAALDPPLALAVEATSLALSGLALGDADAPPAALEARGGIDGIVGSFELTGTLAAPAIDGIRLSAEAAAEGISTAPLAPYLEAMGTESFLDEARLVLALGVTTARGPGGAPAVTLELDRFALLEGEREHFGLEGLSVEGLVAGPGGLAVDRVALREARAALARTADGTLVAGGFPLPGAAPGGEATGAEAAGGTTSAEAPVGDAPTPPAPPPAVRIGEIALERIALTWTDGTLETPVTLAPELSLSMRGVDLAGTTPIPFNATARIPGMLDGARLSGALRLGSSPDGVHPAAGGVGALVAIETDALRRGPWTAYLPPTLELTSDGTTAALVVEVALAPSADGGQWVRAEVRDLRVRDGDAAPALEMERLAIDVPRLDPAAGVFDVRQLEVAGLAARLGRTADGLAFGGVRTVPGGDPAPGASPAPAQDASPEAPPDAPAGSGDADRPRGSKFVLGRVSLEQLGIDGSLEVRDLEHPDAPAIAARVAVANEAPFTWEPGEGEEDAAPELALTLGGAVDPICGAVSGRATALFDVSGLELAFEASLAELSGTGLTDALPDLAETIDGSELVDGELSVSGRASVQLARRGPGSWDFGRPIGFESELGELTWRAERGGPVLAGLGGARVERGSFDPRSGDLSLGAVEIERPTLRARRDADGVHALGLTIRIPEGPAGDAAAAPAEELPPLGGAPVAAAAPIEEVAKEPGPELSVDRFQIVGLEVDLVDATFDPPVPLPLTDLDVEVKRFGTRALREGRAIPFSVFVTAGKVRLPKRTPSSSLLAGMASAAARLATGGAEEVEMEERPLFEEIALRGQIALGAEGLRGRIALDVTALEASAFRGAAARSGVELGDALVDQTLRLRLRGVDGISIESRTSIDNLILSEPPDGPISRYLSLPAPLDTVIFVLRDDEGQIGLPVRVRLDHTEGLSGAEITGAVVKAIGSIITTAIASSPLRVAGTVTDLFGLTGGEPPPPSDRAISIAFEPGSTQPASLDGLTELVRWVKADGDRSIVLTHELGAVDLERAATLANPGPEDCRRLADHLRRERDRLARRREELALEARVHLAVGRDAEAAATRARLVGVEREIAWNEDAIDAVLELLRPSAQRRGPRRARTSALAVGAERIEVLRRTIAATGLPESRVESRRLRAPAELPEGPSRVVLTPVQRP